MQDASKWYRLTTEDGDYIIVLPAHEATYYMNEWLEKYGERNIEGEIITKVVMTPCNRPWGIGK